MYGLANCSISIMRGTSTDQWGDTIDSGNIVNQHVPAFIVVRSKQVYDPSTQSPRTVQTIVGAVGSAVDIRDTDQVFDETHSVTYSVESVTQPLASGITPDQTLELRRVK